MPDYYEILGLPATASREEIRRRYRELARRYHPDVAKGDDAASRFKEINEANSVLADAEKRANYDANRKLAELRRQAARQGDKETRRQGDRETGRPTTAASPPNPQSAIRNPQSEGVEALLREAQRAMARLRYRDAETLARRANRARRTSLGYEILGDVLRARGRNDEAVAMYSYAIQLDTANHGVRAKLDRLIGRPSGPTMTGGAARAARHASRAARPGGQVVVVLTSVLAAALFLLVLAATAGIGSPATGPWYRDWDWRYMLALGIDGGLAGFVLAANGVLPELRLALAPSDPRRESGGPPLAPVLLGFSLLSVYAALALYVAAAVLTGRASRPLLLAFGASLVVTLVFAVVNSAAAGWTLLSGGNLAFVGCMAGWGLARSVVAVSR